MKKNIVIFFVLIICIVLFFFFLKSQAFYFLKSFPTLKKQEPIITNNYSNINNMFNITSIFKNGSEIPDKYGCRGKDVNPPLTFSDIPEGALSLALIVDDPDAPSGDWVHWLVYNIDPKITELKENSIPDGAIVGMNSYGNNNYEGPCPPRATHRYYYKVYAVDKVLDIPSSSGKTDLLKAIEGHVIAQAELMGTYSY